MDSIKKALVAATNIMDRKSPLDILNHVLLQSTGTALSITATDLDSHATAAIQIHLPVFETCILPKYLEGAIEYGGELNIIPREDTLEIRVNGLCINAPTLPKDDFPIRREFQTTEYPMSLSILDKLAAFTSKDETRYAINGIRFDKSRLFQNTTDWIVATDGRRITAAKPEEPLPFEGTLTNKAIKILQAITEEKSCKASRDDTPCAKIEVDTVWGTFTLQTKLIEAEYPNWVQVMAEPKNTITRWNPHGVLPDLSILKELERPQDMGRIILKIGQRETRLIQEDAGIKTKHIQLVDGPNWEASFSKIYLEDMCNLFQSPFLTYSDRANDPMTANNGKFFHVVMPRKG